MNDTPETAAEKFYSDHHGYYVVFAEHAEDLERERDKYQEQADALLIRLGATQERMIDAERERDKYYNELLTKRGLCKIQEQVIDNWKEVAGKNLYEHEEECRQLRASFSNVIADLQDTIFDLRKDRDKLQYKLELWMDEVEKWRAIANDHRN